MQVELGEILTDAALAYVLLIFFLFIGSIFLSRTGHSFPGIGNSYGSAFYNILFGLLIAVTLYSVAIAKGVTINILILPLLFLLLRKKGDTNVEKPSIPFAEIFLITLLSVVVLHLFPESEYKQNDSYYYLQIAGAMKNTGQENTHQLYNMYSVSFHGTEPYHYFEIWFTALVTNITSFIRNDIAAQRFLTQSVFVVLIILGLYNLSTIVAKNKLRYWHKIFCWSLVFFIPDLLTYFPGLARLLVSNIEGGFLERPNFRILCVLLIPIIAENLSVNPRNKVICFWLVLLGIVSFKFTILVIPAMILVGLYKTVIQKQKKSLLLILCAIGFAIAFASFYLLTGGNKSSTVYEMSLVDTLSEIFSHWKFVLFAIAASIGSVMIIAAIFLVPVRLLTKDNFSLRQLLQQNLILLVIAFIGVTFARVLFMKDNAYQFLFAAHIIAFLLIWITAVKCLPGAKPKGWILAAMFFSSPFIIKLIVFGNPPDVFKQNGTFVYQGKKYTTEYLNAVNGFLKDNSSALGGTITDSSFQRSLYYSRRNPNVYFLPAVYIVASNTNLRPPVDISDSAVIMTGIENPVHTNYLRSAIQRSYFYQYRKLHPGLDLQRSQLQFIADHKLSFLYVTAGVPIDFLAERIERIFTDAATGERFMVLKP